MHRLRVELEELEVQKCMYVTQQKWTALKEMPRVEALIFNAWNYFPDCYSDMKKLAFGVLTIFRSTYSCKQGFSCTNIIKSKTIPVSKQRKISKTPVHFPSPSYKPISTPPKSGKLNFATSNEGEAAGVKSPTSSTAAKLQQNYVEIIFGDIAFSALVDSGASFSVISDGLRRQLKKTMFKDSGMTLKVADGKNVTSFGRCTISLSINVLKQPLEFIVLPNTNPSIILG
ncbi:hypothetical protein LAZ67_17000050 [Cordylochernes scorpioides]|uniref:Peptidase A2 domain-containing protein n=1 Tax=Cordylochernes scorpioides TaxID=51811 RepID=A0ABY6LCG5_9ARAC|nr:hypothetical protein LAZ67_17000050 [Cordylochernes scorpioides]